MCAVAREDECCGKTKPLLSQDTREAAVRPPLQSWAAAPPLWRRPRGRLPCVLPQQWFCLATTVILSCHSAHLVLPHQRSVVARQDVQPFACVYMAPLDLCVRGSLSQVLVKYFPQQYGSIRCQGSGQGFLTKAPECSGTNRKRRALKNDADSNHRCPKRSPQRRDMTEKQEHHSSARIDA